MDARLTDKPLSVNVVFVDDLNDNLVMDVPSQIRALRKRAGLSQEEMGRLMGLAKQSSYRYWEAEAEGKALKPELIRKLLKRLVGKGQPPITREDILAMADPLLMSHPEDAEILNVWARIDRAKRSDVLRILDIIAAWDGGDDGNEMKIEAETPEDERRQKLGESYRREAARNMR